MPAPTASAATTLAASRGGATPAGGSLSGVLRRNVLGLGDARAGSLPPVVVSFRVAEGVDPRLPRNLLNRCVRVRLAPHPLLDARLRDAGAVLGPKGYEVRSSARGRRSRSDGHPDAAVELSGVAAALSLVPEATWAPAGKRGSRRDRLAACLGEPLLAVLADAVPSRGGRPRRMAGMQVRLSRTGTTLRILPTRAALTLADVEVPGLGASVMLTPAQAADVLAEARDVGLIVCDDSRPGVLDQLGRTLDRSVCLTTVPAAPGWALLRAGANTPVAAGHLAAGGDLVAVAGQALSWARSVPGHVPVVVAPAVQQAAAAAAAIGERRPGLRPWQDAFVSAYLAAGPGLVNALPPGSGKTVCAAAAMAERAASGGGYRAVVLAPASLRSQWASELGRFFPEATTRVAASGEALACPWPDADGAAVLVLTPTLLARADAGTLARLACNDLVVDEAVFLANPDSAQSRASWALRRHSAHAMVLTGTPEGRGDVEGQLVSFARNTPREFAAVPLTGPHPLVNAAGSQRVTGLVFTGADAVSGQLPDAPMSVRVFEPGPVEAKIDALARKRIRSVLAGSAKVSWPRLRAELEAWRLGLTSPAALMASKYALAQELGRGPAAAVVRAGSGVKVQQTVEQVRSRVAAGEQVLVFSDFTAALEEAATGLAGHDVRSAVLSSAVPSGGRAALVEEFAGGRLQVLLVSATGQLGLNLQAAATVVHLDVPVSRALLRQRTARAARLGGTHDRVEVLVPVLDGCGDQTLLDLLEQPEDAPLGDLVALAKQLTGLAQAA